MEWIGEYGLFLARLLGGLLIGLFVLALGALVVASVARRNGARKDDSIPRVTSLSRYRERLVAAFERKTLSRREWRKRRKAERTAQKARLAASDRRRVFVLDFRGDVAARGVAALRHEVNLVLANANADAGDEVVVRIENSGGAPSGHGLGASQLLRLRERDIRVTAAIDRIAASGGYLMACVAHRIIAAPFAVVGSIGSYTMVPNFRRLLESKGVDVEEFQSGEFKTTVTMFGKTTASGRAKLQEQIEVIHERFMECVSRYRPEVDLERVGTGEFWMARDAVELKLVDEIRTSDDYLLEAGREAELFLIRSGEKRGLRRRLGAVAQLALDRASGLLGALRGRRAWGT